jgi:hypothetical protein
MVKTTNQLLHLCFASKFHVYELLCSLHAWVSTPVFFTPWASPDPNIPEPSTHHSPFAPRRGDQKDRLKRWLALREKSPKCCGRWADVLHGGSHVDICETRPYQQLPWSYRIYLSVYLYFYLSTYRSIYLILSNLIFYYFLLSFIILYYLILSYLI